MPERRRRVLVVEDDDAIRQSIRELLADEGYEVRDATDGTDALGVLADWMPDLIILDLMMPVMDGWEFRDEQRRIGRAADVPLMLLSATRAADLPNEARTLDAAAYMAKPFDLDEFLKHVERLTSG